jgi:hypothetical protein
MGQTEISSNQIRNIREEDLDFSDVTTGNASTLKHGLAPKLLNDSAKFLGSDGVWDNVNIADVPNLQANLDGKSPTTHNHNLNDLTEKSYNNLTDKPTIPTNLDSLTDVVITTPSTGQVLKFNGTTWENATGGSNNISTNITLLVNGTDNVSLLYFTTIQTALNYLNGKSIDTGVTVTIQLADGVHSFASPITIDHPQGKQIIIAGTNTYTTTFSNTYSVTGSAGAYSVTFVVNAVTNISVGDYIDTRGSSINTTTIKGIWKVTAVDTVNKRITLFISTSRGAPTTGATTGTITIYKSIISFTGCDGFIVKTAIDFSKLIIAGDLTSTKKGIYVRNLGFITNTSTFGISAFNYGIYLESAGCALNNIMISGCISGASAYYGVYATNDSIGSITSSYFSGNYNAIYIIHSSSLYCTSAIIIGGQTGVTVSKWSYANVYGWTKNTASDASPAAETLGNVQSYINSVA